MGRIARLFGSAMLTVALAAGVPSTTVMAQPSTCQLSVTWLPEPLPGTWTGEGGGRGVARALVIDTCLEGYPEGRIRWVVTWDHGATGLERADVFVLDQEPDAS